MAPASPQASAASPRRAGRAASAARSDVERVSFGKVKLDERGRTAPQELVLPADVQSVLIEVVGKDGASYVVDSLQGPDGQRPIRPSRQGSPFAGPLASDLPSQSVFRGAAAVLVANGDATRLTPGKWRFTAVGEQAPGVPAQGSVELRVHLKRGPQAPARGALPVNLVFTTFEGEGMTAQQARKDPVFQGALEKMKALYAQAGITLGPFTYETRELRGVAKFDGFVTRPLLDTSGELGPTPESLLRTLRKEGLNVVFTGSVHVPQEVHGVSGGLPGPVSPGTPASGVVVRLPEPGLIDPEVFGALLAHEAGHYLGLPHTVEADGTLDRFEDTGHTEHGPGNVMLYKELRLRRAFSFSPEQARVMRAHPLVR